MYGSNHRQRRSTHKSQNRNKPQRQQVEPTVIENGAAFEWEIKSRVFLNKMMNAQTGQNFESAIFKVCNIPFRLMVCPNGQDESFEDCFQVFVELDPWPVNIRSVVVCWTIYCRQSGTKNTGLIQEYTQNSNIFGWSTEALLSSELFGINNNIKCLNIGVTMNLLRVNTMNHSVLDMSRVISYKRKQQFIWRITEQLEQWRTARMRQQFQSEMLDNMWMMDCCPRGVNKQNVDIMGIALKLCCLPQYKTYLDVRFQIKCMETNDVYVPQRICRFDFEKPVFGGILMDSAKLKDHSVITLVADIEIMDGLGDDDDLADDEMKDEVEQHDMDMLHATIESLRSDVQSKDKRIAGLQNEIKILKKGMNDVKAYLFEEKQQNDDNAAILNVTRELLLYRQKFESLQRQIDDMNDGKSMENTKKLSKQEKLRLWLKDTMDLDEYFDLFVENGFDDMESMKIITMEDLNEIGIKKLGHKKKLLQNIAKLNKLEHDIPKQGYYEGNTAYIG